LQSATHMQQLIQLHSNTRATAIIYSFSYLKTKTAIYMTFI